LSYCRWSSDNFRCELYCYQDTCGGWTTHVAAGLSHDSQKFSDPTLEAFRARLIVLREAGYRFPDWVLERVDAEIEQTRAAGRD
jgi:hypothetical protein